MSSLVREYLFLLPGGILWLAGFFLPMLFLLTELFSGIDAVGLLSENLSVLTRSLYFAAAVSLFSVFVGLVVDVWFERSTPILRRLLLSTATVLVLLNPLIIAICVYYLLHRKGPFPSLLQLFGVERSFLFSDFAVFVGASFLFVPIAIIGVFFARREIDRDVLEAARLDGVSRPKQLWYIEIPMMTPQISAMTMVIFVGAFGVPLLPEILGGPAQKLISGRVQTIALVLGDWSTVAFFAVLFILGAIPAAILLSRTLSRLNVASRTNGWLPERLVTQRKSRLWYNYTGYCLFLVLLTSPIIILLIVGSGGGGLVLFPPRSPLFEWYLSAFSSIEWTQAVRNSLVLSSVVAFLAVFASLCASFFVDFFARRTALLLDVVFLIPGLLPPVAASLALARADSYLGLGPWGSVILGHCQVVFPYTYIVLRAGIARLDQEMILAARVDGARASQCMWLVVVPNLRASLGCAFAFAFVVSVNEPLFPTFVMSGEERLLSRLMYEGMRSGVDPIAFSVSGIMALTILIFTVLFGISTSKPRPILIGRFR